MSSHAHDPSATNDEMSHGSGGPPLNDDETRPENFKFDEWLYDAEKDGSLDASFSLPVETPAPQGALDGNLDTNSSIPVGTSAPQGAGDGNSDTTLSFPVQTFAPQGVSDIVDKSAPSASAPFSLGNPFTHLRKLWSAKISSPTPAQDVEPVRGSDATDTYSPPSLILSTPQKRKRSDKEDDLSPLAPKTPRKRQARNPSWHHFSQPGSPIMIVDGQPCYMAAQAPAPAPGPASASGVKTAVGGHSSANLGNEERYLDSNRIRQMIKKGLAETEGLRKGERWDGRVPGGRYLIECLSGELCAMQ
ncbi:hypothetical protein BDR22DRAFT_821484 [Usnea florida]